VVGVCAANVSAPAKARVRIARLLMKIFFITNSKNQEAEPALRELPELIEADIGPKREPRRARVTSFFLTIMTVLKMRS
jgi:hypothetical protein